MHQLPMRRWPRRARPARRRVSTRRPARTPSGGSRSRFHPETGPDRRSSPVNLVGSRGCAAGAEAYVRRYAPGVRIAIVGTRGIPPRTAASRRCAWELSTRLAAPRPRRHRLLPARPHGRVRRRSRRASGGASCRTSPASTSRRSATRRSRSSTACSAATTRCGSATSRTRSSAAIPRAARHARSCSTSTASSASARSGGRSGGPGTRVGERFALVYPNAIVVRRRGHPRLLPRALRQRVDGHRLRRDAARADPPPDLARHGLDADVEPGRYLLYVSRLEPENQADLVIRAYRDVPGDVPLLIVGDAPYADGVQGAPARARRARPARPPHRRDLRRRLPRPAARRRWPTSRRRRSAGRTRRSSRRWAPATSCSRSARPRTARCSPGPGSCCSTRNRPYRPLGDVVASPAGPLFEAMRASARARASAVYSWDAVTDEYLGPGRSLGAGTGLSGVARPSGGGAPTGRAGRAGPDGDRRSCHAVRAGTGRGPASAASPILAIG